MESNNLFGIPFAVPLPFFKGDTKQILLLNMKKPSDDERAAYAALSRARSRATDLQKVFMVVPISLADLRLKPVTTTTKNWHPPVRQHHISTII